MRRNFLLGSALAASAAAAFWLIAPSTAQNAPAMDSDDIGGTVSGAKGPEAGVWVIAETTDLPTKYAKIVVTDDRGRFLIPDLPRASYRIWVRGYGLVDSPKVTSAPGKTLALKAVSAPNEAAADHKGLAEIAQMRHRAAKGCQAQPEKYPKNLQRRTARTVRLVLLLRHGVSPAS